MIKLVISAERGTSEVGIVFLHTARKYRFECMREVFGSHSIQRLVCFVAIRHCLTFHVYFRLFQHLKKYRRSRLYGIHSHILVSHFFVTLWQCNISDLWF